MPAEHDTLAAAHHHPAADVLRALGVDAARGLTSAEARDRLARHGRNEFAAARREPAWRRFAAQLRAPLVVLLLAATAFSFALWLYERASPAPYEAIAIGAVILLNAILGFVQEGKAESAIAALREISAARARVLRDGAAASVPAAEVVPGDILLVEEGDTIAADARLVEAIALRTIEAALTGESLPASKEVDPVPADAAVGDRSNMIYSGTTAAAGRGRAVVTGTGMQAELGRIAGMLTHVRSGPTPLQQELDRVGRRLGLAVLAIAAAMIAVIVAAERVVRPSALFDVFILGVALAVAAVPEGLPAVVTAVLALGVQRMARRRAIVRQLSAVETLGSASVIASDKTGTLTRTEMTVREVVTASGHVMLGGAGYAPEGEVRARDGGEVAGDLRIELERVLAAADRASNASVRRQDGRWIVVGDPTEGAIVVAAWKAGVDTAHLQQRFARVGEVPFSAERRLMSTVHTDAEAHGRVRVFTKGAPDVLLARCTSELVGGETRPLSSERRQRALDQSDAMAGRALRTLAVAFRASGDGALSGGIGEHLERDLVFAGLVGMIDPPRDEARAAVARAKRAGVRTVMITGDHPRTAAVIARELGLSSDDRAVSGAEIERMTDAALARTVAASSVFARVNPAHKLRIVEALQRGGAVVAMTGDGVNDAPALEQADIGVAMGVAGTDVSKQAADMVLADDNFATIVAAVEEGRSIFANIRKFLRYLLSSNIGEVMTMFFGVLLAGALGLERPGTLIVLPLAATQLLWINLVTDGAPALALGVDPGDPALMERPPRPAAERVITARMWRGIVFIGAVMAAGTLYVLDADLPGGLIEGTGTARHGQTMAFTTLMLFQLFNLFNARSDRRSAFHGLFRNGWLWGAVLLSILLQVLVVHAPFLQRAFGTSPLDADDWLRCALVASTGLWLRELEKLLQPATGRGAQTGAVGE
ncbi:MAG: cation-translocating P-type ATPase [Acidobacteria bacterium]|nr:cation-translocating P-type ATPase [Acidobacteriota bacterium]